MTRPQQDIECQAPAKVLAVDDDARDAAHGQHRWQAHRTVEDPWLGVPDITRAYRELGLWPICPTAKAAWRDGAL